LSVVVVHRAAEGSSLGATPRGHRRPALSDDPMEEDQPSRSFRRVLDRLMTDIADRRDDDRDETRS
jgi:hypothetical protein